MSLKERKKEKLFEEAMKSIDKGNLQKAIDILDQIPRDKSIFTLRVLLTLGNVYWDLKNLPNSLVIFQEATNLSPKTELASLGLFHTLWEMKREDEAFEEMKRFLTISKSEEYTKILKEMK